LVEHDDGKGEWANVNETDEAAIQRVRTGESDAFRILVERHGRGLFRLAYRITGNEADAEDVVQESFIRAYRGLSQYDGRATFQAWIYRIASNYALDLLAARKRRNWDQIDGDEDHAGALASVPSTGASPERLALDGQLRQRVEAALGGLTELERAAFVLRHFEGLPLEEIGGALGISLNSVKQGVFRAVQKMRAALRPVAG
jgi:RNA polymerase sigma-70 factor (ECF subfamily)